MNKKLFIEVFVGTEGLKTEWCWLATNSIVYIILVVICVLGFNFTL